MKKITKEFLCGLLAVFMFCSLTACNSTTETEQLTSEPPSTQISVAQTDNSRSITVNSSETVCVVPDIAQIVYAVRTEAKTASDCQAQNAESISQVIELLKSLGINEASIQTSDYYMHPIYNYSNNTSKVVGYEATTSLTVSDLPIADLDSILSESVLNGINTVQSITYMANEYDKSYQEALTKAVEAAYTKAQVLASASGCEIGTVIMLQETSGYSEARYTDFARSNLVNSYSAAKEELTADTAAVMPGEISVEASVLIEYELK